MYRPYLGNRDNAAPQAAPAHDSNAYNHNTHTTTYLSNRYLNFERNSFVIRPLLIYTNYAEDLYKSANIRCGNDKKNVRTKGIIARYGGLDNANLSLTRPYVTLSGAK